MSKRKIGRKSKVFIMDKKFIVNKDKGIVICKLLYGIDFTYKLFDDFIDRRLYSKKFPDVDCNLDFTVVGKAKCHGNDVFDETLGKSIAEGKAKCKMFNKISAIFSEIGRNVNKIVDGCNDETYRYGDLANRENSHVNNLIK